MSALAAIQAVQKLETIQEAMDRLSTEGASVILCRRPDFVGQDDKGREVRIPHWEVQMPTMQLKSIPKATGTDPLQTLALCEEQMRIHLANPQFRHKP